MGFARRIIHVTIFLCLFTLQACARSSDCSREDVLCVGLVTDTQGINDFGVNQSIWQGLQESDAEHVAFIESVDTRDYEKNISKFVNDEYDVIITSGVSLRSATLHYADLEPDITFVGVNQAVDVLPKNLSIITFAEDQAGFAAGYLAAKVTRTNIIGAACESNSFDSMHRYCEGFRNGALYANTNTTVLVEYRSGDRDKVFIDEEWGKSIAKKLTRQGADVIFAAGGGTAQGVIKQAVLDNVLVIGAERDQWEVLAESRLGVMTSFWGSGRLQIQALIRGKGGQIAFGEVSMAPFRDVYVSDSIQKETTEVLYKLATGVIKTNVTLQSP